ncbi:MAG: 50S ribosomal protein L15e [Nitrososphaeria archaeon]|nr:50S ribosomal protein L15e [Aigarchaeota archaeon]MCX8187413.1 50S ribosomal protein L15e [Nitrososphaeria archaeon]MDW8021346.1 50S ribosomal protein L15e [Nitrososphaerota archaeon]
MGVYTLLEKLWRKKPEELRALMRQRLIRWRKQPAVVRVRKPLRLDKARKLGYKAKQGFVVLRVRVRRGGFQKPRPRAGRRPKALGVIKHKVNVSMKEEAIHRAQKRYPNLYPVGAYWIAEDGLYKWYEVIMVDPHHPAILNNEELELPDPLLRRVEKHSKKGKKKQKGTE